MRHQRAAAIVALAMAIGACGPADSRQDIAANGPAIEPSTQGGFGALSQVPGEFDPTRTSYAVTGVLRLDESGCWGVEINSVERLVALPEGFVIDGSDGTALVDPEGSTFRDGAVIDGTVRFFLAEDLPGGSTGRWGQYLDVCKPAINEIAVLDDLKAAYDPTTLTSLDFVDLISNAEFTEAWPCGRGWATSTTDQRVGVVIYQIDDTQPVPGASLVLPDPGWTSEILVGKYLFTNHCNDAIEEWMPTQILAGRFALSGTISIHDAVPANADPPGSVSATLSQGAVDVDGNVVSLPSLTLRNVSYNAFAG